MAKQAISREFGKANKHKIKTAHQRESLPPYNHPYWHQLEKGKLIGYRQKVNGYKWVARKRIGGKYFNKTLILETADPDKMFENAVKIASEWFGGVSGDNVTYTLRQCIDDYEKAIDLKKGTGNATHNASRVRNKLPKKMLDKPLSDITAKDVEKWFHGLVKDGDDETIRKSKNTANKILSIYKASMNYAYKLKLVSSREWDSVEPFIATGKPRLLLLTPDQIKRLLEASSGGLHDLILAGIYTGARLGELTSATVSDFDGSTLRLTTRKGKTGMVRERKVILSGEGIALFKELSKSKLPGAYLLTRDDGKEWKKNDHARDFKRAVRKGKLPHDTVYYSLRHYHISMALDSMRMDQVAKNCGTSTKMIEDTYGKSSDAAVAEAMNAVSLIP